MLDKSRLAKKPDHSVLQPMEDLEKKANSQAVYTGPGNHSSTQWLSSETEAGPVVQLS